MSLEKNEKSKIIKDYGRSENDTGSAEVQIALLTTDINRLTEHFKTHKHDHHSRRGLMRKVSLRRNLLNYLKNTDIEQYRKIISKLKLRG